jgi:hypothetical protein
MANSYRAYQRRTEARRLGREIPETELDPVGHAKIFGKQGGGIVIEHIYHDGSSEEHHFDRDQHPKRSIIYTN